MVSQAEMDGQQATTQVSQYLTDMQHNAASRAPSDAHALDWNWGPELAPTFVQPNASFPSLYC